MSSPGFDREFVQPDSGVVIPLSTIIAGGKTGVLHKLVEGTFEAEQRLEDADEELRRARQEFDRAEIAFARAEATAVAWCTAHDSAKEAFSL